MVELLDRVPEYEHPLIRQLHDYWCGLCERVPGESVAAAKRSAVDPLEILPILPFLWIYEREADGGRFICRLAGERVRAVIDRKVVNEYLDDMVGEAGVTFLRGQYDPILNLPATGYVLGHVYPAATKRYGVGERLILPLRDDAGDYRFIMGATLYRNAEQPDETLPAPSEPLRTLTPLSVIFQEA